MYIATHLCSSKLKPTSAQCLQHPKKSYFSDIQNEMRFTFGCTKSVKKLEEEYYTNNICIIDAVQICIRFHPSLQIVFKTLKLKFWS